MRWAVLALVMAFSPLLAKAQQPSSPSWQGDWRGTTATKQWPVQVTIAGDQLSYCFRGELVPISDVRIEGDQLTFQAALVGIVTLSHRGSSLLFAYRNTLDGSAGSDAVLSRSPPRPVAAPN